MDPPLRLVGFCRLAPIVGTVLYPSRPPRQQQGEVRDERALVFRARCRGGSPHCLLGAVHLNHGRPVICDSNKHGSDLRVIDASGTAACSHLRAHSLNHLHFPSSVTRPAFARDEISRFPFCDSCRPSVSLALRLLCLRLRVPPSLSPLLFFSPLPTLPPPEVSAGSRSRANFGMTSHC